MIRKIYHFIVFCILINACSDKQPGFSLRDTPILINIQDAKEIKLDTITNKHISYIPLETNDKCLIGDIEKIIIKHDKIHVADFTVAKALFVFDIQGKFLFKIDRKGKGPGEYVNFHDFDIFSNGDIYIWDVDLCKFLIFSSNGTFIQDLKLKHRADYFCILDNQFYLSQIFRQGIVQVNLMSYSMLEDKYKEIIEGRGLYDSNLVNSSYYKFYFSPVNTYYAPRFSEIVYSIDDAGIHPAIGLTGLPIPPKNIIKQWSRQPNKMLDDKEYLKDIIHVYETENYISMNIEINFFFNLIYEKTSRKSYSLAPLYKTIGIPFIMGSTGSHFFGILTPDFKNLSNIINHRKELSNLTEDSNPVVVLFDFQF
jgi:hypothetical protein